MTKFRLLLFLCFVFDVFATRPQLVDQKLWFINRTVLNFDYEVAVVQMEFDQDMYLTGGGESFLCGLAEEPCPERDCVPCDWSSQQPTGCENVECCGPAQKGGDAWDQVNDWCEPDASDPPYHTLNLHERSEVFTVEAQETVYFRFFVSEEFACKPFKLKVRPFYGVPVVFLSNLYAVPSPENAQWRKGTIPPSWGWAQNDLLVVCPGLDDYQLGTFSLGIFSWFSSSFDVEIIVSPQDYPLVPPPDRILCEDVPESEMIAAQAEETEQPIFCLQDTETIIFDYDIAQTTIQLVLPIPSGCHQVSFATIAKASFIAAFYCHSKDPNIAMTFTNSVFSRWTLGENRMTFSMCSDTVSYVRCAMTFWIPGLTHVIFSTVSIPGSIPLDPNANTAAASFTYQEALTAIVPSAFGIGPHGMCGDFGSRLCRHWMVPSLSDPLIFWPPPPQLPWLDTGTNVYGEYYNNSGVAPLKNTVTTVIVMAAEGITYFSRDQLDQISLTLLYITNELGEPPVLPNSQSALFASQYLPTITMSSFPQIDLSELCNQTSYDRLQSVVNNELTEILESISLETIEFHKYALDIFGAGIAASSCTEAAIEAMNTQVESVTLVDQTFCHYESGTQGYADDPCCNFTLKPIACCVPFTIEENQEQFTTADSSTCGTPECADTYFEDLAQSLNHVKDLIQGCSSGVENIQWELASVTEKQLDNVVRDCLDRVGFRDDFEGIDCVADFECGEWSGRCNHQTKKCVLGETTSEVEDAYLQCYISKMSSSLEEYLRVNILPPEVESAPRDSEEFFLGLKSAALVNDCVATNEPLDIFLRSRYVWTAAISCKARILGLSEDDVEGINALCPARCCLGTVCRESSAQCFRNCEPLYVFHESSESECSSSSTVCPVAGLPGDECEGTYCLYCPGGEDEDCIYVPGDQDFCENTVACELEDGGVVFGLTEEECDAQIGSCSVDCPGESCRSLDGLNGVCLATVSSETLCENLNSISGVDAVWYEDTICVVNAETLSTCTELSSLISVPTNWGTCESVGVSSCNGEDPFQRYLKCFVDLWHRCESQEDCENSGHCADRFWTTIVRNAEHPIDVQFGACFTSGEFFTAYRDPYCLVSEDRPGIGCRDRLVGTPEECLTALNVWRTWLTPAMSETECRNKNVSRYGCQQPGIEKHLVWLGDEECDCRGGVSDYAWEWTQGVWRDSGVSRTLHWREVEPIQKYQWTPALSFELLQTWLEASEEQRFSFAVKSEVICENGYISFSLNTLVCDCFSNSDHETNGDSQCYVTQTTAGQVEQLVGLTGACVDETSFVKGPASQVSFGLDSITTRCTLVNLSIVSEAWFVVPPPRPSVSFEFEDKPQRGIVLNQKSATVGVLRGDGTVLSFSMLSNVKSFSICLLVSEHISKYTIPDFGYSKEAIGTIFPLGMPNLNITFVFGSQFWCGTIIVADVPTDGNSIRLYPISRVENYEYKEEEYTSRKTRALMYTLGVCYCICFVLLLFYLASFIRHPTRAQMLVIISFLLSLLCVFRIVFMFGYPNAIFEGNELAEFVVFEIPTFLLFSVVITSIFFWKKLSARKRFFAFNDSDTLRAVIVSGLVFVWSLWVVVTIVYAEVILKEDGESSCPGRVALSYDEQEEDTRTLAIVYQSLIISVTFVLGAIFCYYSFNLLNFSEGVSRSKRFVMVIGGVIVLSFFVRCILFIIILAADFVSSVYMFVTLMITEVFLLFFLQLQFNFSYVQSFLGGSSTGVRTSQSKTPSLTGVSTANQ